MYETRKTYGTSTYEVRLSSATSIEGPYDVVARDLSHTEALYLTDVLNSQGWPHMRAYETVQALVDTDSLHAELYTHMNRTGYLWQIPSQAA